MVVFFFLAGIVEVFVASVRPTSSWRAGGGVNFFLIQKTPWGGVPDHWPSYGFPRKAPNFFGGNGIKQLDFVGSPCGGGVGFSWGLLLHRNGGHRRHGAEPRLPPLLLSAKQTGTQMGQSKVV